jgi:Protein of unknown function (DUF2752).
VLALLPPCPFKAVTGLPCPACGSGRASAALAAFDIPSAFTSNPLFTLGALVFLAGGLLAAAFALAGGAFPSRGRFPSSPGPPWSRASPRTGSGSSSTEGDGPVPRSAADPAADFRALFDALFAFVARHP